MALPETLNDDYFRRSKAKKVRHGEGEIFEQKKASYVVSEQRKKDQVKKKKKKKKKKKCEITGRMVCMTIKMCRVTCVRFA